MGIRDWAAERIAYSYGHVVGKDATIDRVVNTIEERAGGDLTQTTKDLMKEQFHGIANNYFLKGVAQPDADNPRGSSIELRAGVGNFSAFMHEVEQHPHMGGAIVEMADNPALMEKFTGAFMKDRDLLDKMAPALKDPKAMVAFKDAIKNNPQAFNQDAFAHMAANPEAIPQALEAITGKSAEAYAGVQLEEGMDIIAMVTSVDKSVRSLEKVADDNPELADAVDKLKKDIVANEGGIQGKLLSVATAAPPKVLEGSTVGNVLLKGFVKDYGENPTQALDTMGQKMEMVREGMAFINKMDAYVSENPSYGYTKADVKATAETLMNAGPEILEKFSQDNKELQVVGGLNSPSVMEGLLDLQKADKLQEALAQDSGDMLRMEIATEHASRLLVDQLGGKAPSENVQKLLAGLENDPKLRQYLYENKEEFSKMMNTGGQMSGMLEGKMSPVEWVAEKYANGTFVDMAKEKGLGGLKTEYMKDSFGAYGPLLASLSNWADTALPNFMSGIQAMLGRFMGRLGHLSDAFAGSGFINKLAMGAENGNLLSEFGGNLAGAARSLGSSIQASWDVAEMGRLADVLKQNGPIANFDDVVRVHQENGTVKGPDEQTPEKKMAQIKDPMLDKNPNNDPNNDPTPTPAIPVG